MGRELPEGLRVRHVVEEDQGRVLAVLDAWWGGFQGPAGARRRAARLPRLFFQHFADTSSIVERPDGRLAAFLVGFLSQSRPGVAYIHFVGVDPALRRSGVAAALYARFIEQAAGRGAHTVRAVASPRNTASIAFHTRLGFDLEPSDHVIDGVPVQRDHDGPGLDRVAFTLRLDPEAPPARVEGGPPSGGAA